MVSTRVRAPAMERRAEGAIRPESLSVLDGAVADAETVLSQAGVRFWIVASTDDAGWTTVTAYGENSFGAIHLEDYLSKISADVIGGARVTTVRGAFVSYSAPIVFGEKVVGLLCGFTPEPALRMRVGFAETLAMSGRLLSSLLTSERTSAALGRRLEAAEAEAEIDELTRILNRRGWNRSVDRHARQANRRVGRATMIMMDVDGLKSINDRDGHACGDRTLRHVADVIRCVTRENDIVARLGGDEFALLALGTSAADARVLHRRLQQSFAVAGLSVSMGVVHCANRDELDRALERADALLYAEKSALAEDRSTSPAQLQFARTSPH